MTNQDYDIKDFFSEDDVEGRLDAEKFMADLPLRKKQILYLFVCGHTQGEIGETLGLCQQRISQLLANISKRPQKIAEGSRNE